jgi:transcriptional regulator with XRE-family HTH domain
MHSQTWDRDLFGQILGQVCDVADLSQADLARITGKSQSTVSRWTRSQNQPNYDALKRLVTSLRRTHPHLGDLPRQLMVAAGYGGEPAPTATPATAVPAGKTLADLRVKAQESKRSLGELLVREGLADWEEFFIPDVLPPDEMMEEIISLDIPDEKKANLLRLHLENRARRAEEKRLEEERLGGKKPDGE